MKPLLSPIWAEILSEWLVNLSAGWFGVAFAIPTAFRLFTLKGLFFLTANAGLSILALILAKRLRELARLSKEQS